MKVKSNDKLFPVRWQVNICCIKDITNCHIEKYLGPSTSLEISFWMTYFDFSYVKNVFSFVMLSDLLLLVSLFR